MAAMSMGSAHTYLVTTFITLFEGICFNKLPFEISSAPEHFQKQIYSILKDLVVVLCQDHHVLVWPGSEGGERMYHIHVQKALKCYLAVLGKLTQHEHIHALYIMYTYGVHLCDFILVP